MKNFLQVNRALAAEKNFNLIEWLQTDSHGKQSATRDHHGTKSRELPDNPRLYRYPCATLALPLRYVAMIFAVLVMSMANIGMAWGAYTPTADEVIILNTVYNSSATGTGYSDHSAIAWGGTASTNSKKAGDPNNGGAATSSNVNCYSVKGNGSGKNITVSITGCSKIIVYHESHASRYVELRSESKSGTLIGKGSANTYYTEVTLTPATSYTIFLHGTTGSDDQDFNVYAVKLIKGSSCAAANLTAANITSNGDQIVGTGITFTKVGNPASGDTWYWQTSSTGTDKTYNASSAGYTTATTTGSYTVYLRAYNTAADCWGTAIGKTNSVYSCPINVYNGENVDKGNTTASGWTINSSTNMTKTNGSSNGYSYWYQAGSASNYVQFDGSMSLVSGDKIKIQWTHTNGSNKTLQLTINGSSASLTSGSQANSSTLVEAVYDVTSTTTVTSIKLNSSGSSGCIIYQVSIVKAACDDEPSCSAPSSVSVDATNANGWRYSLGETIDLTCTATGGTGTKTYQWQKYIGSTWTDINTATNASAGTARLQIANCTSSDGGSYRCVVSTGATCSLESDGYYIRVFTLNGAYYGGSDTENAIVWTDANTGVATVHLNASSTYMFKVTDNDGRWFGNGENNYIIQPVALDCGTDNQKLRLLTGPEGDYTFTINVQHAADVSPYVNIATGYPTVSHPDPGYMYITKWWDHCYVHYWEGTNNALSPWGYDPEINSDRYAEICGTNYWYFPLIDTYNKFIAKNQAGDPTNSNTTGDQVSTDHGGKYITHDGSWGWHDFSTYTITYAANGGGGSMSATSGICPDADQAITSNAFTAPTGCASFAHWTANVAVKVGGETVAAGNPIANGATIQDINSNIILTAVWKLATPTITDNNNNTFSISGSMAGSSYYYTTNGGTPTTSSSLYSSAVDFSAGETNITAKAIAHKDGYVDSEVASQECTYHAAAVCAISSCGNATLTYAINVGSSGDHSTGGADLISSATASNTTALGISTTPTYQTITMSALTKSAAAKTNDCYATAPNMTGKIGCYYGTAYNSSNYLQFTFTIKSGYTFTPCDIQFVVQPVSDVASFRWEVTDGTSVYGYGTAADVAKGSTGGASVLTGLSSTSAMNPGTYYIRLYPFSNYKKTSDGKTTYNTFRLGTDVILKGTTAEIVCSTPDDPDGLTAGSITTDGATFTISDDANTNNYEIYYSTSSTAPTASTPATTTSTSKTKAVTGLTASTTYYAWVRSVCDASHKSAWVALSGSSFTTEADVVSTGVCWDPATTPADKLANNTTTLTTLTSRFAAIDGVTSITVDNPGTGDGQCAGSDDGNGYLKVKNASENKIITIVTTAPTNITIGGKKYGSNTGSFYLVKSTDTETKLAECNTNAEDEATSLPAGTYYIYAKASTKSINFSKLCIELYECSTPAAPTAFSAGSITSDGVTFSITDAGNAASYDIYYATSSTAPMSSTAATTTSDSKTKAVTGLTASTTYYAWVRSVCDADHKSAWVALSGSSFTTSAPAATYSVTHSLTNVTATSGATGAGAATEGVAYDAVFSANTGYVLPSTITVTIGGSPATVGTGYTWNASTGAFQVPAAQVTGAIVITIAGETAPATKDIYYGAITITTGALTRGSTGTTQFFTNIGGTIENNTEISWSSGPSTAGQYYNSNNLTDTELSKSGNWSTGSSSNKYIQGFKFQSGSTFTLALGSKVASSITFYGRNGSESRTMTVGGEEWTSSATKNTHAKHEFTKSGGFTGNVSITQDGDFYGILVITIQTATPCTTPVIPALSNQSPCEGTDIAEWDATVTNAAAIEAAGESIAYSWKKKGNDTELANTATFDLGSSATESQAGTYVVTVTVSKAGKASSSAYREVELSVTEETEVTNITADKATVYAGNSVTLTATANATPNSWQWYTCTNAGGDGEAIISDATSASYTITSAPAAGTHYYKVKVTSDCGNAERVYALTVSEASGGDCETEFWFAKAADKPEGATAATHISGTPSGSSSASYTATIDGNNYTITGQTGQKTGNVTIVVPENNEGTLYVVVQGSSSRTITLSKGVEQVGQETPANSTWGTFTFSNLDAGTYTLVSSGNIGWGILALKLCSAVACSDPEVTASADNTTACVGTSVTFTAANAHASATYQWQKLDGTWTNISGANASTYTINPVVAGNAGKYRVIASHDCNRTSNEVTLSVPSAPDFGSTVPASVSVMQTIALSINTVEATDAVKYRWYKSADPTWDAGDVEIGTNKELIKAYDGEAIGSPSYYIFCRAQNSCGITTSSAIAVNVTDYVEEDCATRGNEGEAQFGFENTSCSQGTYSETAVWTTNSRSKYLTYTAPDGKYFKTAKLTVAVTSGSKCGYAYSTDGGTTWTYAELTSLSSTLTEKTINLSALGGGVIDAFRISRNLQDGGGTDHGVTSGNFHLSKACFEYTDACTATTVTPSESSVNYEMGGAWSNPTFTLSVAGTLTYSSSNEDIASVDDYGTVTFNGEAGTVTITASYAGDETYCASSGSYTINVSCPGGAPKVVASGNTVGCSSSITLLAKKQDGTAFEDGTYQWFRNGTEIDGATSSSYTATQAGTYTVERTNTSGCTTPSTNSAVVTSETTEPEVERLVPFQYYHVNKTYSDQMKMRHLFAVKNSGKLDGKSFKMYVSRSGGAATDVTNSAALEVWSSADGRVDTVMVNLNELSGKYSENEEVVYTCKAIDCSGNVSEVYKNTITMRVIGATPTLALICSGSSKAEGTRKESELTVGGDFLTGYNKADLCEQTGKESFNANIEWGLYTRLKANYIVTPVNGYAVFNKLNYEPFDILLLTDYPKASKSDAAKDVLDDMADLCDYRPMLSFKAHMVAKSPSKWAAKGFTTAPVAVKQGDGRTHLNIVCYAHPMFDGIKDAGDHIFKDNDATGQIVYEMLTGAGHESGKGIQGFEIAAAENFVTIGLIHYNASVSENDPSTGMATWTGGTDKESKPNDRILVAAVERQANPEARMVMLAVNCGAQSKFTETGRTIVHKCLQYLLSDYTITPMADCSFTFDNGAGALHEADWYKDDENCPGCTGTLGDGKWSTAANWAPDRLTPPGKDTEVKIAASVEVDMTHAIARSARIVEGGHITIPAGKALEIVGTIRRLDGTEISPTENSDITIGSSDAGNGTLIFNNDKGDAKARVLMYSNAQAADPNTENSAANSVWQYIGTPHTDVANARSNYYGSWLYQYVGGTWDVIPNGGPLVPFRGYCITNETAPIVYDMAGTLAATTTQEISIPAGYTVIANSWTAPIDISTFTDDDMENISDKTIYFFNTGTDADGNHGTGTEAGTYVAVPKNSASYVGTWQIPSMQGFYVSTETAGTLHLDYERHVRPAGDRTIVGNKMYAPRRAAAESDEPNVLKIFARGSRYQDKLVVLEREDFTRGYDSGWDGEAWGGGKFSPMVYVTGDGREDAVSAIPEFEGTVVAFKAGEDSDYHFDFIYDGEESLYLFDTENNTYTQIMTGESYYFSTDDKAPHSRFILTRRGPQIATGIEPTSDSSQKGRAKKLLIENKMYILLNGALYDATGKAVK